MATGALIIGLFMVAMGIVGVAAPSILLAVVQPFATPLGLYAAAALRITIGIVLMAAASASRTPAVLRVLGFIILVAGLITPFFGVDRSRAILAWWSAHANVMRLWAVLPLVLGSFVVYSLRGRRDRA